MSYIFGGDTGISYEQLQQRRKMAERLRQANSRTPRNAGEGIHAIARALVARGVDKQNTKRAEEMRKQYSGIWDGLMGATGGGASYTSGGSYTPAPPDPADGLDMGASGDAFEARKNPSVTVGDTSYDMGAPTGSPGMQQYRDAIASIESAGSGDYKAIGPTNERLGRALGRYQIMEANIGPWSREVLGREVTPEEFLANPNLQDAIFDGKFGQYVQQFGPEGAAQAWFAGPGGVGKMGRKDVLGTSVGQYTQKFQSALGGDSQPVRTAQAGGLDPSVVQLAQMLSAPDEFMPPGQKAIAQALLQQKIAASQPPKPMTPLQRQQFEMNQIELEGMRNPQPTAPEVVDINGVDSTWNEQTGQFEPITVEGAEAAKDRPMKQDANGRWRYTDGKKELVFEDVAEIAESEDMTESERRIFMFGAMQDQTAPAINMIEKEGFNPANVKDKLAGGVLGGNWFKSTEGQMYEAAASAWIEGALRLSTGAAANAEEFPRIMNTYFAAVGDSPETIAFKRTLREAYQGVIRATLEGDPNARPPAPLLFAVEQFYQNRNQPPPPDDDDMSLDEALSIGEGAGAGASGGF